MKTLVFKINILFILFLFTAQVLTAQVQIDEDFLDNIEKNTTALWAENTNQFNTNTTPDKYKKESAVIIGFKRNVTIDKKSKAGFLSRGEKSLLFYENVRFKIKLNDRNSVKSFTEIYFRYSDKEDGFSARVFKKGLESKTVSLADAVKVESVKDVPEFFKSFFDQESGYQNRYYKVAIPDLEAGDVLEYVAVTKSKLDVTFSGYVEFSPQYEICSKSYPILFNQIAFETDNKSYFKSLSLNGAPEFKKETSNNDDFYRFVFTDVDRPVEKDVNFINAYKEYPFTKFQIIYANKDNVKGALIGQRGEIKSNFTKEELAKKAWEDYILVGDAYYKGTTVQKYVDYLWAELKKQGAKSWSDKEYIKNVYYRLRNVVVYSDTYMSDKVAVYLMGSLLYQKDIKSELIISVANSIGKLKDILFEQEIRYVLKIGNDLYFNFTDHSNPGELVESLLGSDAYIIEEPVKKTGAQSIKPVTLPNATIADNTADLELNVSLAKDMNSLNVLRTSTYRGINKNRNINDALRYTTYMLDDYKNYDGENPTEKMSGRQEEEYDKYVKALKEQYKEAKPEFIKKELENEFSKKVVYKDFELITHGRSLSKKELSYKEDFELHNMVRKAGKKLLINIPGLVGSQLQIKKEQRNRKYDIDVDYARAINWKINFKIPEGYTAEGLKELNTNIDNEIGTYNCTAEEVNNTVVISIKKIYKQATFPKTKWNDMLSFVDQAFNTSFKSILLKPKQ
jgi:hypothetical protein